MQNHLHLFISILLLLFGLLASLLFTGVIRHSLERLMAPEGILRRMSNMNAGHLDWVPIAVSRLVFWILIGANVLVYLLNQSPDSASPAVWELAQNIRGHLPQLSSAIGLLLVATLVAWVLKALATRFLHGSDRMTASIPGHDRPKDMGWAIFWFTYLLFIPALLETLGFGYLIEPAQQRFEGALLSIPRLGKAAGMLLLGGLVAQLARKTLVNLLRALGADRWVRRGTGAWNRRHTPSSFLGTLLFLAILLPVTLSALDTMAIPGMVEPVRALVAKLWDMLPGVLVGLAILALGYWGGKVIGSLVEDVLAGAGFDKVSALLGVDSHVLRLAPSRILGVLAHFLVGIFALAEAFAQAGFYVVADLLDNFNGFALHLLLGVLIVLLGIGLGRRLADTFSSPGTGSANPLRLLILVPVVVLATSMGLWQMGIAPGIILMVFGILLGSVCIAAGIAFGVGAKDIVREELQKWYQARRQGRQG